MLLLADIRQLFTKSERDKLASSNLVDRLARMDERPWPEYRHGKPITQRQVASLLKAFGITPRTKRHGSKTFKGYELSQFDDALARYLADTCVTPSQTNEINDLEDPQSVTRGAGVMDGKSPNSLNNKDCNGVTDRTSGNDEKIEDARSDKCCNGRGCLTWRPAPPPPKAWSKPSFEVIPNPPDGATMDSAALDGDGY